MKTSELTGPALDWAIAKCEGYEFHYDVVINGNVPDLWLEHRDTQKWVALARYKPSTFWSQGGPIIEREEIGAAKLLGVWTAAYNGLKYKEYYGPTPLIAAMRAFVASRLGDEVEIPEELA